MKTIFPVLIVLLIAVSTENVLWEKGTEIPPGRWPSQDVVYDPTNQLWACCFNPTENIVDCTDPGNETFEAPAPSSLVVFEGATASATVAAVIPAPISTLSSPTPTRPIQSSTSLQPTSSSSRPEASSSSVVSDSCKCPSQQGIDIGFGIGIGALGSVIIAVAIAYRVSDWRVYRRNRLRPNWRDTEPWERNGPPDKGPWDGDRYGIRLPTKLERQHPTFSYERIYRPSRGEGERIIISASPITRSEEELRPTRYERIHRPLRTQRERIIVSASRNNGREDADRADRSDREPRVQHMRERERSGGGERERSTLREREQSGGRERERPVERERERPAPQRRIFISQ